MKQKSPILVLAVLLFCSFYLNGFLLLGEGIRVPDPDQGMPDGVAGTRTGDAGQSPVDDFFLGTAWEVEDSQGLLAVSEAEFHAWQRELDYIYLFAEKRLNPGAGEVAEEIEASRRAFEEFAQNDSQWRVGLAWDGSLSQEGDYTPIWNSNRLQQLASYRAELYRNQVLQVRADVEAWGWEPGFAFDQEQVIHELRESGIYYSEARKEARREPYE